MLTQFGSGIWLADGRDVEVLGFRYSTRMAVIRLESGALFVWSPVHLTEDLLTAVNALGPVGHIIAPNALHHLFLADWTAAYPQAICYAPPGLREKRQDIEFTGDLGEEPDAAWVADIDQVLVRGNLITTEAIFFHRQSRTVLITDLIQNFPEAWFTGWRAVIARLDLMVAAQPSVPRKFQSAFTNRSAARASVGRILEWPAERLVMAHGVPVTQGGKDVLAQAFKWLF